MLRVMSPRLFDEWFAFYTIEPFGEEHYQMAMISSSIYNAQGSKKDGSPFLPGDFLPNISEPELEVDQEKIQRQHLAAWKSLQATKKLPESERDHGLI